MIYFFAILFIIHVWLSASQQKALMNSKLLEKKQKVINSVLLWAVPFIWLIVLRVFLKDEGAFSVMTKEKRGENIEKYQNTQPSNDYSRGAGY
jgi:hypothetical protein